MLGLVGGILFTLMAVGALARYNEGIGMIIVAILMALQGVPLFPMFFALGTVGAREHFRVICPQCGHTKVKGGDFLFTKAICRKCNTSWDSYRYGHDMEPSDGKLDPMTDQGGSLTRRS